MTDPPVWYTVGELGKRQDAGSVESLSANKVCVTCGRIVSELLINVYPRALSEA